MGILQTLKATAATRPNRAEPVVQRRNKLLKIIHDQIAAATAASSGKRHTIIRTKRIKNPTTGEISQFEREANVRECWWNSADGKTFLELRYGYKPLEIVKGKCAVEVGEIKNLVPTFEKLRDAVAMGEFDSQLTENAGRLSTQLKAKRSKSSK